MGISPPPLYVIPNGSPLKLSLMHNEDGTDAGQTKEGHPFIIVTEGRINELTPLQLGKGILAHEEAHVRNGDTTPAKVAAAFNDPLDTARVQ